MLTEAQLAVIRSWIGAGETDEQLNDAWMTAGSIDSTIRFYLRVRISELAGQPQSFSVPGLSITNGVNIKTWADILAYFNSSGGSGLDPDGLSSGMNSARLVRVDLR